MRRVVHPLGATLLSAESYASFRFRPLHTMPCLHLTLNKFAEITALPHTASNSDGKKTFVPAADTATPCGGNTHFSLTTWGTTEQRESSFPQEHIISLSATSFCCHCRSFSKLLLINQAQIHHWSQEALQFPHSLPRYQLPAPRC